MLLLEQELRTAFVPGQAEFTIASPSRAARLDRTALQFDIVDSLDALERLEGDWNDLFERAGRSAQVFQTHGFVSLFARTYGQGGRAQAARCTCSLAIVTARRGGRLVLVWPLVVRREFGVRVLSWLGEPIAQYGDVVLDPSERAAETLLGAWAHILGTLAPDALRLRKVRADAALMPFLTALGVKASDVVEAPCITLAAGGSAFETRQSSKAKKNRRRLMRRLEEQGTVEFREIGGEPAATAAITAGLADKREWLARRGLFSAALADSRFDQFMIAAAGDDGRATGGTAFSLTLDGRQIALAVGFRAQKRLMLHLISYAAEAEKHGAGVLNLEAILKQAEAEGLEAVDLLPPKADYKLDWADTSVEVGDHCWGISGRGRAWCALYDGFLRPRGKALIARLPLAVRSRLAPRKAHASANSCPPIEG